LREHARLTLEARTSLGVVANVIGQDLERHLTLESCVLGAVDLTHPALAEQIMDLVRPEAGATFEGQEAGFVPLDLRDRIRGGQGDDRITGGRGNDRITGNVGNDWISGGVDRDRCIGGGEAGDSIRECEV